MRAITLAYHDISRGPKFDDTARSDSIYTISFHNFVKQLAAVKHRSETTLVRTIADRSGWIDCPLLFTFDDGGRSAWSCAAFGLESFGWRGHFFITTDWLGRDGFLKPSHLRDLFKQGHVIGSHTCSHPERMSALKYSDLVREWKLSRQILADVLNAPVNTASVAGGYHSSAVIRAAAEAGIKVLFTSEPTTHVRDEHGCLVLGRYVVDRYSSSQDVGRLATGEGHIRQRQAVMWGVKAVGKGILGPWYPEFRRTVLAYLHPSEGVR